MEKLKINFEHYNDGLKGFYVTYEVPVMNSTDSREIIHRIKAMLGEDGRDNFGGCGTDELASIFNVTQNTIMNWVRRDGMPMIIKNSKGYRFSKEDVFDWIKKNKPNYKYLIQRYEDSKKSQK